MPRCHLPAWICSSLQQGGLTATRAEEISNAVVTCHVQPRHDGTCSVLTAGMQPESPSCLSSRPGVAPAPSRVFQDLQLRSPLLIRNQKFQYMRCALGCISPYRCCLDKDKLALAVRWLISSLSSLLPASFGCHISRHTSPSTSGSCG